MTRTERRVFYLLVLWLFASSALIINNINRIADLQQQLNNERQQP